MLSDFNFFETGDAISPLAVAMALFSQRGTKIGRPGTGGAVK